MAPEKNTRLRPNRQGGRPRGAPFFEMGKKQMVRIIFDAFAALCMVAGVLCACLVVQALGM
jgi:hypothetical protein